MNRRSLIVMGGVVLSTGCLRTDTRENNGETNLNSDPDAAQEIWNNDEINASTISYIELDESLIVCSPETIARIAYDDGSVLWEQSLADEIPTGSYPETQGIISGSQVFVGSTDKIHALDIETGAVNWTTDVPTQESDVISLHSRFVSKEDTVLCGYNYQDETEENYSGLTGIESTTGRILWEKTHSDISEDFDSWLAVSSLSPPIGDHTIVDGWNNSFVINILTGEINNQSVPPVGQTVLVDNILYGIRSGNLLAWRVSSTALSIEELWKFEPLGNSSRGPVVDDGVVYISADDTEIYAVEEGNQLWRYQTDGEIVVGPVLTETNVWAVEENIHIIDQKSGDGISTSYDQFRASAISASNNLVIVSDHNSTVAYRNQ